MKEKLKNFFYLFDLIGISPQLFIFKENKYKSILSFLLSTIIILLSISFAIFSLTEYFKYDSPIIVYSKDNDEQTERSILIKDLILMFQLVEIIDYITFNFVDESSSFYEAYYIIVYNNGTIINTPLPLENCKLGINLDSKYEDLVNGNNYGRSIEKFYCIDHNYGHLSLFYDPNVGFSYILIYLTIKKDGKHLPENLKSLMITENNIIDHYNKTNPIQKSYIYKFSDSYSFSHISKINYNFQFVKYESDEGLIFKKIKQLKGVSFSDMTLYNYNLDNQTEEFLRIGSIEFLFNKSNFDNYRRSYQKLQSLLAEIMSVISLLFEIGKQLSYLFCNKKMSCDIIESIFNKNINKRYTLSQPNLSRNRILSEDINNEISFKDRSKIKYKIDEKNSIDNLKTNNDIKENKIRDKDEFGKNESKKQINQINFGVNFFHSIKSFLCCFQDNKTKLINHCNNIINEDLSVERFLERFYNLENFYHILSEKNNIKDRINPEFIEINEYIKKLNIKAKPPDKEEKVKIDSNININ